MVIHLDIQLVKCFKGCFIILVWFIKKEFCDVHTFIKKKEEIALTLQAPLACSVNVTKCNQSDLKRHNLACFFTSAELFIFRFTNWAFDVLIHRVWLFISHLVHKFCDYISDWHMLRFTSTGLLVHWLRTWLLISRQLYQESNSQTIKVPETKEQKAVRVGDTQITDMNDLDCNGYNCCFSWKRDARTLNPPRCPLLCFTLSLSPTNTHKNKATHAVNSNQEKHLRKTLTIKTFIIAQNCTASALNSHDNRATCSVPIISSPCIQMYLNGRCLDPLYAGKTDYCWELCKDGAQLSSLYLQYKCNFEDVTPL